jgi:hypothetical protein
LTHADRARSVVLSPEGPSDANGGDHLNAHASSRFLRAFRFPGVARAEPARTDPAGIIAPVDPQLLIVAGFVTLSAGVLVLLSFGPRFRVGRLLAATPTSTIAAAREAAAVGQGRYVRLSGRVDSESEFEDAAHRPLVFRRTRIQLRRGRRWQTQEESREQVPFELSSGLDAIDVDVEALDIGLVVLPRESTGRAADLPDRLPPGTRPDTPARVVIEQVSSVEHAIALGQPIRRTDGSVVLTSGTGRPLVLTTLELDDAMRVLTGGDRRRTLLAASLLGAGLLLVVAGLVIGLAGAIG